MVGTALARLCPPYDLRAKPSSIIRMLFKSSRCAPKPPRASLTADFGEASSNAAVTASGTALIQSASHRREFFGAAGIRPAASQTGAQHSLGNIASRAAARPTSEQRLHRQMREHALTALGQRCRRLAQRDQKQQPDQIDAGAIRVHGLDQARIAIDQQRRATIIGHDVVDRQRTVPIERLSDLFEMRANDGPPHALLDRLAAAHAGA